jgi:CBS domain-containing protein
MSPRAAWRLEALGFDTVYEYAGGKADWTAAGLPTEGAAARVPKIGALARADVPTCRPDDRLGDVRQRVRAAGWDACMVVNEARVVMGRLDEEALGGDEKARVEDVMRPGPVTYRPDVSVEELRKHMDERGIGKLPVTDGDGRLLGMVVREDLGAAHEHRAAEEEIEEPTS